MKAAPTRRLWKRIAIAAVAVCGVLVAGAATYAGILAHKADTALSRISAGAGEGAPAAPIVPDKGKDPAMKPMLFLIAGVDNREGGGGSMNTDVMMLAALNPERRAATIVSLPRDVQLKPKGLSSQKANYYYAYYYNKDRNEAITNTKSFFGDLLGLPVDYMAVINFDGFRKLVDALGGVRLEVDMDMRYIDDEDGTNINLKKGLQTLTGSQTLDFVRYRKSNQGTAESSDIARNERQHIVLEQLLDKLTTLGGITQWGKVLDIAGQSLKTDIPESVLRDWIGQFRQLKPERIDFVPIDGKWDSPYIVPAESAVQAAVNALRAQLELPENPSFRPADVIGVEREETQTVTNDTYRKRP
ncbi:LCP family protein [Paenibacillus hodogayensis]|uniref:LCP family protein n=1 Tax=Paenibacillus hodogayensis TaxID=279208 RepID=A0ABV5W3X3_9BACL